MKRSIYIPILAIAALALFGFAPKLMQDRSTDTQKIILVELDVKQPRDAGRAYSNLFDRRSVELDVSMDDPLSLLEDYSLSEDRLDGPDCFLPQLKLIYQDYTYVFSLYCTSVVKYKNQSPFKPSGKTEKSDIRITESVLDFLEVIDQKYFKKKFDPRIAERFHKDAILGKIKIEVDDSILLQDDDEEEDKELEKDAEDKEGWFDNTVDPGLEEDKELEQGEGDN